MIRILFRGLLVISVLLLLMQPAWAEQWVADVERLCSTLMDAENLSAQELKAMIAEFDDLIKVIEKSEHPKKKLFLFRAKKCRNFYQFTLDTKELNMEGDKK